MKIDAMLIDAARLLLFPALMAFVAASDLFTMTISNRVTLALVAGFFALAFAVGMSQATIASHLGAGGIVLAVGFMCFAFGWIGGGDAKLAAATALWFGFDQLMNYLLLAALLGGALTMLIIVFRKWPLPPLLFSQDWVMRLHRQDAGVPYGIALAVAALLVYPETPFMKAIGF